MHRLLWIALMGIFPLGCAKAQEKYPVDPQTGRTIGRKIPAHRHPHERDPDAFAAETIKGAINIPIDQLKTDLKKIPKDTSLFFT